MAAALIDREVNQNGWPANDPFFLPGSVLDNMPNYQTGIIQALGRFAVEMVDQIGRTRGSSQADPDLDKAAGLLKYAPNVWIFDFSTSWAPTASSESQYRAARKALLAYNEKLMSNKAVFERRTDNLLSTLDRFAADIGSVSAIIDQQISDHSGDFVDFHADDVFYNAKGKLYAYALLFRALGRDFAKVIAGPRPGRRLEADGAEPDGGRHVASPGGHERPARRPVRAQSPGGRGLLSDARPHPAARDHEHPGEVSRHHGVRLSARGFARSARFMATKPRPAFSAEIPPC